MLFGLCGLFRKVSESDENNGITIHAVTPQNEPGNGNNEGGAMLMDVEEEIAFVKVLATAFHNAGLSTKIYLLTTILITNNMPNR